MDRKITTITNEDGIVFALWSFPGLMIVVQKVCRWMARLLEKARKNSIPVCDSD